MAATMDHSDIRGLGTAFHLFFAGLPRSRSWDHHMDARIKLVEGSPHRVSRIALPFRCRSFQVLSPVSHLLGQLDVLLIGSGRDLYLPGDIPDEACELAGDRHATLVLSHFSPGIQFAKAVRETKLRFPGDIANGF